MRSNPTEAEKRLWSILRAKRLVEYKFKRQVVIDNYIVDFINFKHRLIVEADGSQHLESAYDRERDSYLRSQGFLVLRFWNNEILRNPVGVSEAILAALEQPLLRPPSREGRETIQTQNP